MWGLIPTASHVAGDNAHPSEFSRELLPVGTRWAHGVERPRAVSEHLIERMIVGGATRLCIVIPHGQFDLPEYYGGRFGSVPICYVVQPRPLGFCDALFRALPFFDPEEAVLVGLPDTLWFPKRGFRFLPDEPLSFLVFPAGDAPVSEIVVADRLGSVVEIQPSGSLGMPAPGAAASSATNAVAANSNARICGAFKLKARLLHELSLVWLERNCQDESIGTLVNAYIADGGRALAVAAGESFVDTGAADGYRQAIELLSGRAGVAAPAPGIAAEAFPTAPIDLHASGEGLSLLH